MKARGLVVGLLVICSAGCGGDGGSGDGGGGDSSSTSGGTGASGLPNACELFTEADTAPYGGLGEGSHTSAAIDLCIYTETIDDQILQISVSVGPTEVYEYSLATLDDLYPDYTKTSLNYGEESFMYLREMEATGFGTDSRGSIIVLQSPYTVQVDVRLNGSEAALADIVETVLGRL